MRIHGNILFTLNYNMENLRELFLETTTFDIATPLNSATKAPRRPTCYSEDRPHQRPRNPMAEALAGLQI